MAAFNPPPDLESFPAAMGRDEYPADYSADFRRTWHAFLEKSWVVGLLLVICLAAGMAYIHRAPVLYSSTATIQVEEDQQRVLKIENMRVQDLQTLDYLQTVVQSLKSRSLLEQLLVETNRLKDNPKLFWNVKQALSDGQMIERLDKMIDVKLRRGTRLIDVSVKHTVPALTESIANTLVNEYFIRETGQRQASGTDANKFLDDEAKKLAAKLKESESKLQVYKESHNASSLDEKQNTVVAKLKELSTKVTEAKSQRIKAETDYNQVQALGTNVEALLTLAAVANDQTIQALKLSLSKAENDFAALRQRYKSKHPKYIQAQSQITDLNSGIADAALQVAQTLKANLDAARASESALEEAMKAQEASALELNKLSIEYSALARDVESDRALYESVLNRMKETAVTKDIQPTKIRWVQHAYLPEKPVSPKKTMIMALSGLVGVFAGVMMVLFLRFLDTSLKTVDEAEAILNLPVLSAVPQMREVRRSGSPLVVAEEAKSAGAEAFRTLRTSLSMLGRVEDRRVFLFTSAVPSEGKTFCSTNYAASLAQLGLKTLLIDGDLRRPSVEKNLLGQDTQHPGVTDYLTGQKTLDEIIRPTKVEKLSFISGGTTAPNPAELLARDGLGGLIQDALGKFDRVVVDSAPVHAVSDTLLMLKNIQTLCLVVRAAWTPSRSVLRCVQQLRGAGAPLSGAIMNRMPRRRTLGYGYYYDYHYHGKYNKAGVYGAKK